MLQHFLRPLALLIDLGVEWLRRVDDAGVKRLYLQIVRAGLPRSQAMYTQLRVVSWVP